MVQRSHRGPLDRTWPFNDPVRRSLLFKTARIADKLFNLAVFVLPCCHPQHFVALIPQSHFATARRAVTMRLDRLSEPNPVLETKRLICQRTDRTNIDHVARELVINRLFDVCGYLGCISPSQYAVYTLRRQLIGHEHATVA